MDTSILWQIEQIKQRCGQRNWFQIQKQFLNPIPVSICYLFLFFSDSSQTWDDIPSEIKIKGKALLSSSGITIFVSSWEGISIMREKRGTLLLMKQEKNLPDFGSEFICQSLTLFLCVSLCFSVFLCVSLCVSPASESFRSHFP